MSAIGKKVFDDIYLHISAVSALADEVHQDLVSSAIALIPTESREKINVIKLNVRTGKISFLAYEGFETEPFPVLAGSWTIEPTSEKPTFRTYTNSFNPPILHRKELLVDLNHPKRQEWVRTTEEAEAIGLFENSRTIGFKKNWERLIADKGYCLVGSNFSPLGNATDGELDIAVSTAQSIHRHLTALNRASLSAPVQLLIKHGLLSSKHTFFDFGCGRGTDVQALQEAGIHASGWDPHYAAFNPIQKADVVNLGFVVNVIEDAAERVDAIHQSFALAEKVLAVSVMLYGPEQPGRRFRDGYITSRNTFQKYFTQGELKDYLEHALGQQVFMVGPGVALIFADKDLEQRFNARRFRSDDFTERLLTARILRPKIEKVTRVRRPRISQSERQFLEAREILERLWTLCIDLGRLPEPVEVPFLAELLEKTLSFSRATRLIRTHFDQTLLGIASKERADELLLYLVSLQFEKRPAYRHLEASIQRDIKYFYGDYKSAQAAGLRLLLKAADPSEILAACDEAAAQGVGWLETNQSLQFHIDLLDRLPVLLRAYVNCGLILWGATSDVDVVKIHVGTGKLTLHEFKDFAISPLPLLLKRIKINLRKQDFDIFEYGSEAYPHPILYRKSRYMHEDMTGYAEQLEFDEALEAQGILDADTYGPSPWDLQDKLNSKRLMIQGFELSPAQSLPDLDALCGANFTYRSFIECGETQQRLALRNIPLNPQTYNALYRVATEILDPVIDYFGGIRLTYGFSSSELAKHIEGRIAPKLDQHAGHECNRTGRPICDRLGAAVDFAVDDEDMLEVAQWIAQNCRFDRIYYYGKDRPIHISASATPLGQVTIMQASSSEGRLVPKTLSLEKFLNYQAPQN